MINTATLVSNIITDLTGKTWTSTSGSGTTTFDGIFSFRHWDFQGSPFLVILDRPIVGRTDSNKDVFYDTQIELHICSSWAMVEAQDKDLQRREAMKNLREAWDFLKAYIPKESTLDAWFDGSTAAWTPNIDIEDADIIELNLYRRIVRITLMESVTRLG